MKIAVLISSLIFDSQKAFMKGIERRVRDYKDVCHVFGCNVNIEESDRYNKGEYAIYSLPDLSTYDGIVYVKNTFQFEPGDTSMDERIKASGVPCVCIDSPSDDYINILSKEGEIMETIVDHLVEVHDCKKIGFVGGIVNTEDTALRFEGLCKALQKHGLSFDEKYKYDGNYQFFSGVEAADYFMSLEEGLPDAIACANDEMAIGMAVEFKKRGVKVPKNLKITGVDFDSISRIYYPRLTTVKRQQYQKGVAAVTTLHEIDNHTKGERIVMDVQLACGETCGCKPELPAMDPNVTNALATDKYVAIELEQFTKRMSAETMDVIDYKTLVEKIKAYTVKMNPEELYLCINTYTHKKIDYEDYVASSARFLDKNLSTEYTDEIISSIECIDGKIVDDGENRTFSKKDLMPPVANGGREGSTYYFFPVHYLNRNYGYVIAGRAGDLVRNDFVTNWIAATSVSLENVRKKTMLVDLIDTLDDMWTNDTLTGINNRAGFGICTEKIVADSIDNKKPVGIVFMDADGLKKINDEYGHEAGDNLIKGVAKVLSEVSKESSVFMRYGGDEFVVLLPDCDDKKAKDYIEDFKQALKAYSDNMSTPYSYDASVGYAIGVLEDKSDLDSLIRKADFAMYEQKKALRA